MSPLSDDELLRLIYRYLDVSRLCAEHPAVAREQVDDLFRRLAARHPPSAPPRKTLTGLVVVHSDGASKGNPGPAGVGFVILDAKGRTLLEGSRHLERATSNEAEYEAAIAALREALRLGARQVELRSDSELLVRQLRGEYRVRNARLAPLHARVKELAARFDSFRCCAIPREENSQADALASAAAFE